MSPNFIFFKTLEKIMTKFLTLLSILCLNVNIHSAEQNQRPIPPKKPVCLKRLELSFVDGIKYPYFDRDLKIVNAYYEQCKNINEKSKNGNYNKPHS
jgi:hypothetical protein